MKCIMLAAGYATRLYPLTKDKPKHLIEINGKPILEHIIEKLEEINIEILYIVTNEKFYNEFNKWSLKFNSPIPIKIINDKTTSNETRLGAIGNLELVIKEEKINDDALVILGDNIFDFSLVGINKYFEDKNKSVVALYDVKSKNLAKKYGIVSINKENKLTNFIEKPQEPESTLASIGIYFYPKDVIISVEKYLAEGNNPEGPGFLVEWLVNKKEVYGYVFDSEEYKWFDIGSFESLEEANEYFSKNH